MLINNTLTHFCFYFRDHLLTRLPTATLYAYISVHFYQMQEAFVKI